MARPIARHPDCTCGFRADGRYNVACGYHKALNARLDLLKDRRPYEVRQAEAKANVARIQAEIAARGRS